LPLTLVARNVTKENRPRDTAVQGGDVASDEKERRKKRGRKNIQY
jgi:hypothetical protein